MNFFRGRPSTVFRSALALLLVCAQIFAAAHALSHVGELSALARGDATLAASVPYEGGMPAAERHERCLLCLAAADLAASPDPPRCHGAGRHRRHHRYLDRADAAARG